MSAAGAGAATTRIVCADGVRPHCEFSSLAGLQAAVDASSDGDRIRLRRGVYRPERSRDIPYEKLTIRGAVVIDGKRLEIIGDPGAVLDGSQGVPASAIVVRGGKVTLRHLAITGFRAADSEDDTYDGHGLFFIDAEAKIGDVRIERIAKMALTARGASRLAAQRLEILDGHVGIWLEETSHLELEAATIRGNESAGICAYGHSSARIAHSTFEANRDDGVYTEDSATIEVADSTITRNTPYGIRATGESRIAARRIHFEANEKANTATEGRGQVVLDP